MGVISPKRRVALPSKFRKELGENPIVARWYEGCLVVVSKGNWKALLARLTGKVGIITQPVRDTDRFILGSAFEIDPDDQGRVVIPKSLSDYAGLKKEIIFLGLGDRVEIWNREAWEKREDYVAKYAADLIEKLGRNERKEGDEV